MNLTICLPNVHQRLSEFHEKLRKRQKHIEMADEMEAAYFAGREEHYSHHARLLNEMQTATHLLGICSYALTDPEFEKHHNWLFVTIKNLSIALNCAKTFQRQKIAN